MPNTVKQKRRYKQTEVGIIPEDWEVKQLGEIFTFLRTAIFSRSQLSDLDGIKYVHYGDIHTKFSYHIDISKTYLPKVSFDKAKGYPSLQSGDLVLADASEDYEGIGKSIEIVNDQSEPAISGLHTVLLRPKQYLFARLFLGYINSNKFVKTQFNRFATGLKVYGLSKKQLFDVYIPLPPLPEQKAIAKVLSDADSLIVSLDKLIAKKKAVKQGAMEELLTGKCRLPGFAKSDEYKQTEVGLIPEDWEVKQLREIGDFFSGGTPSTRNIKYWNGTISWFTPSEIGKNKLLTQSIRKITSEGLKNSSAKLLPLGTILLTTRATIGEVGILTSEGSTNQGFQSIVTNSFSNNEYIYYLL